MHILHLAAHRRGMVTNHAKRCGQQNGEEEDILGRRKREPNVRELDSASLRRNDGGHPAKGGETCNLWGRNMHMHPLDRPGWLERARAES